LSSLSTPNPAALPLYAAATCGPRAILFDAIVTELPHTRRLVMKQHYPVWCVR
jgi:hypothetical protein